MTAASETRGGRSAFGADIAASPGSWLAAMGWDRTALLVIPAVVLVLALFVYPFGYGLVLSFEPMQGGVLENYANFFTKAALYQTIATTLWLALPATLVNVFIALPIAFQLRRKSAYQRIFTTILVIPITLGTVLVAEGMLTYLGPQGWFNRVLMNLHLIEVPVRLTHNYWGVLLSLVITGFPFAFLLILSYITGIDPVLAQAASTLGARPGAQFRHIYLPLLVPGLAICFCLSFVQAFSVFPSAVLLGAPAGPTRVISIAAYQAAFEDYDYSMASAIAMIMGAVQLLVVIAVLALRGAFYKGPATGAKG
ncbi:MAG TPA: sugar ABC transporter permease [Stellaceae bacterium]|nr:sugar ABC transporter permease [Stellaceae bacterium]